jgi:hypothetical protein
MSKKADGEIVVIQCAGAKRDSAGRLKTTTGKPVFFVARPDLAPHSDSLVYARPDDKSDDGRTWRQVLLDYNATGKNPQGLLQAYELYCDPIYRRLGKELSVRKLYILSAGWGLVSADFLLPDYDITFTARADRYKRRRERFADFRMLPDDTQDDVVFFGGMDYVPLFCALTESIHGRRTVFYKAAKPPQALGCRHVNYKTTKRTNWQYECANAFLDGKLKL